jgi:thymidylate synthase (FAD)
MELGEIMNSKISVLNRGFIEVIDAMGNDMSIVNAAKISYNRHFKKKELDNKDILLLKHMAKERHWTPFSHTSIQLHIKMPIFIARQ